MIHLLVFLTEASLCLILMYACYILFISNDTFYELKRYYLLFSIVVSITIPQLPSTHFSKEFETKISSVSSGFTGNSNYKDTFGNIIFGNAPVQPESISKSFDLNIPLTLILIIYLLGVIFLLYRLMNNIVQVLRLAGKNGKEPYGKYTIVHHEDDYPTFSFFRYIFLNGSNLQSGDLKILLQHEETHIIKWHSADIIFVELYRIIFWFNPIIRNFKESLIKVHECQADGYLIDKKKHDIANYQTLLLKQYLSKINIELAHPFNYSLIKYRIKMMTKTKSGQLSKLKVLFALPVVIFCLLAFSNANTRLAKQEFAAIIESDKLWEPEPNGMCYIPAGSFNLKRTDGSTIKEFQVTIDPFWMNQTEVSVKQYMAYLESVRKDSIPQFYEAALPDKDKMPYADYLSNKKYSDFPVVGVNLKQARNFCKWMTSTENLKLKRKGKPPVLDFRIPSEVEWVYASFGSKNPVEIPVPEHKGLSKVSVNKPNDWGLYNMNSNVSEWTNTSFDPEKYLIVLKNTSDPEPGDVIARGENYKVGLVNDKLILNSSSAFDYVGFRYVRTYLGKNYGL
jgi:formylglycine-generating enzyme required for sulfatase activity